MSKAKTNTSEARIGQMFEIVKGFNITLADGTEKRFEAGKRKGQFVEEKDFAAGEWKALFEMGAVMPVVADEADEDEIAAEIIKA